MQQNVIEGFGTAHNKTVRAISKRAAMGATKDVFASKNQRRIKTLVENNRRFSPYMVLVKGYNSNA